MVGSETIPDLLLGPDQEEEHAQFKIPREEQMKA